MNKFYFLIITVFLIIGTGCSGSKSYSRKARKLQEAGLNDEAARFYLMALQRNQKNVDAQIGLKQTGQIQIETTLTAFYKAYSVANYKEAVYKYQEALNYKKQYGNFVTMTIPPYYQEYYQEMLVVYLDERYDLAGDLFYDEKYREANLIFKEILKLDPDFRNVKDLSLTSTVEPLYRDGVNAFNNDKYRACYQIMSNVLSQKPMYKDAFDYKDRALEEGRITLAVLQFESRIKYQNSTANSIQSNVISGLIKKNDPFLRVIDRSNMDALVQEQKINVHNTTSGNSAIKAGELLGANMLLKAKIITYTANGGTVRKYRKQGFESYQVKMVNKETKKTYYETRYKRVNYVEFEGESRVYMEVQYQLISAETGEVVKSDVLRKENTDYVNYISYGGNYKNLYAAKYSGKGNGYNKGDVIYNSYSQQRKIKQKVKTHKRTLMSAEQLTAEMINTISGGVIRGVSSYNPDND